MKPEPNKTKRPKPARCGAWLGALVARWLKNAAECREYAAEENNEAAKQRANERAATLEECAKAVDNERHELLSLATRKDRACGVKKYLVADLESIAERCATNDSAHEAP